MSAAFAQMNTLMAADIGSTPSFRLASCALLSLALAGCRTTAPCDHSDHVANELSWRTGYTMRPDFPGDDSLAPLGADLTDGVTEHEATALALWNNAAYRQTLAELGISSSRLFEAALLHDPQLVLFFPLGPKQLELTAYQASDLVWARPVRIRAAKLDLNEVAGRMVQHGLELIRDTRIAHADLLFAQRRAELANDAEKLLSDIADLSRKRLRAGDISELEATSSQIEALRAAADATRFALDVSVARQRLAVLIGRPEQADALTASDSDPLVLSNALADDLVATALALRPDLRAAEIAVEAACERVRLARRRCLNLDAVFDANGDGDKGFEAGPGLRFTLPIFNRNRGAIAIAQALLEQAERRRAALHDQIAHDVRTAHVEARQAAEYLQTLRIRMLPAIDSALTLARKGYLGGGTSYLLVLQTASQFLDARAKELEWDAALRRAAARLDCSVGHRTASQVAVDSSEK